MRQQQKYTAAAKLYTQALPLLPPNSPAAWVLYYDRAMCFDQSGDWPRAQADLEQALKISPGQPYVLNYLGYSWAVKKQNMAKARAMIEQALQVVPNDGAIVDSLGYVLLQQGQAQAAVRTLTQAVKLIPEDPTINAHSGRCLCGGRRAFAGRLPVAPRFATGPFGRSAERAAGQAADQGGQPSRQQTDAACRDAE